MSHEDFTGVDNDGDPPLDLVAGVCDDRLYFELLIQPFLLLLDGFDLGLEIGESIPKYISLDRSTGSQIVRCTSEIGIDYIIRARDGLRMELMQLALS